MAQYKRTSSKKNLIKFITEALKQDVNSCSLHPYSSGFQLLTIQHSTYVCDNNVPDGGAVYITENVNQIEVRNDVADELYDMLCDAGVSPHNKKAKGIDILKLYARGSRIASIVNEL